MGVLISSQSYYKLRHRSRIFYLLLREVDSIWYLVLVLRIDENGTTIQNDSSFRNVKIYNIHKIIISNKRQVFKYQGVLFSKWAVWIEWTNSEFVGFRFGQSLYLTIESVPRVWDEFEFGKKKNNGFLVVNILFKRFSFRYLVSHAMRINRNIAPPLSSSISVESFTLVSVFFTCSFVIPHKSFFWGVRSSIKFIKKDTILKISDVTFIKQKAVPKFWFYHSLT